MIPHFLETSFLCTYIGDLVFVCFLLPSLLGGVITTQIVLFYTLITTGFEQFLHSNQPN